MRIAGWIGMLILSKDKRNQRLGRKIKERQEKEYMKDVQRLYSSPCMNHKHPQ